jgi:hypothetical protein
MGVNTDRIRQMVENITAQEVVALLNAFAEAEDENVRWLFRMADIRDASGLGAKPMLDELPGEIAKIVERALAAEAREKRLRAALEQLVVAVDMQGSRVADGASMILDARTHAAHLLWPSPVTPSPPRSPKP